MQSNLINKLSFKSLVLGITALTFTVLTVLIAFFSSLNAANELAKGVYQEGLHISRSLAENSVVPLLYDSELSAEPVIDASFAVRHVSETKIVRANGITLVSRKEENHIVHPYPVVSMAEPFNVNEMEQGWYFSVLVVAQTSDSDTSSDLLLLTDDNLQQEALGYVNITVSKSDIDAARRNIFINNFIVAAIVGVALLFLMYIALSRITRPLEKLSRLMEQGQRGDYHSNADIDGPKEISDISITFNKMIHAISEREQNLVLTLNSIAEGVIVTDSDGLVIRLNPNAEQLFSKNFTHIIGMHINNLIHLEYIISEEKITCPVCDAISNVEIVEYEEPLQLHLGENDKRIVTCSASPIVNPGQTKASGAVLVINDVTEKQKQEEMLRRSQKLDALGKLTSGIAHDYNNMLAVTIGYAELLKAEVTGNEKHENYTKQIIHACERGANLTRKLLTFSRNSIIKREAVDLNKMLTDERDILEKTLTARIHLTLKLDDSLAPVMLNAADLEDAIINMSINAMHAMENGGELTISTHNRIVNETEAASYNVPAGQYSSLSIADTGSGIDKDKLKYVFDPFFTTKGNMGTGLGLSQVHGFVTRSNGIIKIYSEVGHGTQITLCFPIAEDSSVISSEQEKIGQDEHFTGSETILIVDDEPILRQLTTQILEASGYEVFTAENGTSALQLLNVQPVDLLLTDVIMPGMNGYELAREVRRYFPYVPIMLASGFSDPRMKEQAGINEEFVTLQKPYNHQLLLKQVRLQLDNARDALL